MGVVDTFGGCLFENFEKNNTYKKLEDIQSRNSEPRRVLQKKFTSPFFLPAMNNGLDHLVLASIVAQIP